MSEPDRFPRAALSAGFCAGKFSANFLLSADVARWCVTTYANPVFTTYYLGPLIISTRKRS